MKTIITTSAKLGASFIQNGEIVAFPTETVYGLGADAFNEKAIGNIFKVKGRPSDNPLIVHINEISQIELLTKKITQSAKVIIENFFPGPITIVLKKNEIIPDAVTAGLDTIAIRMPSFGITRKFIEECGVPVAAPSANISGSPSPTSADHVFEDLDGKIPCILKGPRSKIGIESTVVDCTSEHPVILRPGSISLDDLKVFFPEISLADQHKIKKALSPGMKYKHYSPKAEIVLFKDRNELTDTSSKKNNYASIGKYKLGKFKKEKVVITDDEYAKVLFDFFRKCDKAGIERIYCQIVEEKGIGAAIMNRLKKASNK